MAKSSIIYTLYMMLTVIIYRTTELLVQDFAYREYFIFFGAELPVIAIALLTVYYNKKAGYSGIVTAGISVLVFTYGLVEFRFGSYLIPGSYVVSMMHWSLGLLMGVTVLCLYRRFMTE